MVHSPNNDSVNPLGRSAADIVKGDLEVLTISEAQAKRLLDPQALLDGLAQGFRDLAGGSVQTPHRSEITVPDGGFLLTMPAWREGSPMMVKTVCVFEGNLDLGLPNHLATIALYEPETGRPLCIMDGTHVTAIRTAAAAVLSVRALARADARVATIVGAGVQAREHVALLDLARPFEEILVHSLYRDDARKLAEMHPRATAIDDLEAAVRRSDAVCLATHAYQPVIDAGWVAPGTHVSSVGYAPPGGELPAELARTAKLYVEDAAAFSPPPVGCGELSGIDPGHGIAFGDALSDRAPLRESPEEITVYKAMGIAMEDLVAAELIYRAARAEGLATSVIL